MPLIKRYPNRKLYDTEAKQYVTLEGIATLVRQGEEVSVVDHATGDDLTAVTLTQVILEQEKKRRDFVPAAVLTGLVRAGGDTVTSLRRALAVPLHLARQVDEEIERRLQALVERGELAAGEAGQLRDRLTAWPRRWASAWPVEEAVEHLLVNRGVPTGKDLAALERQLERLEAKIAELNTPSTRGERPA
jgi:polyhydroxyalkanoate synthesis repressor PhaR